MSGLGWNDYNPPPTGPASVAEAAGNRREPPKPSTTRSRFSLKTRMLLVAALVALASAAGVFAYWTTTGNGSASASAGSLTGATISGPTATTSTSVTITWIQAAMTPSSQNSNVTYIVERKLNSGSFSAIASGGCSGSLPFGTANCVDTLPSSPTTASYTYRAVAHFHSAWTANSNEVTVGASLDSVAPTATVSFPTAAFYNSAGWGGSWARSLAPPMTMAARVSPS